MIAFCSHPNCNPKTLILTVTLTLNLTITITLILTYTLPPLTLTQCYIERNKSGTNKLYPEYILKMKDGDRFMLCAKKRSGSNPHLHPNPNSMPLTRSLI